MIGTAWTAIQTWPLWLIVVLAAGVAGLVLRRMWFTCATSASRRIRKPPPRIIAYNPRDPDDCNAYQQKTGKSLRAATRLRE